MQLENMLSIVLFEDHKYEPNHPGNEGHKQKKKKGKKEVSDFVITP